MGSGVVTLDSVEVLGKVIIQGSGDPSVQLKNTTLNQVNVQSKSGTVRLVTQGLTLVKAVSVQSSVILEEGRVPETGSPMLICHPALQPGS